MLLPAVVFVASFAHVAASGWRHFEQMPMMRETIKWRRKQAGGSSFAEIIEPWFIYCSARYLGGSSALPACSAAWLSLLMWRARETARSLPRLILTHDGLQNEKQTQRTREELWSDLNRQKANLAQSITLCRTYWALHFFLDILQYLTIKHASDTKTASSRCRQDRW